MIKWIKSLIEKIFGKFCKCEVDEHITMYTEVPKSDIKVVCEKHPDGYKKSFYKEYYNVYASVLDTLDNIVSAQLILEKYNEVCNIPELKKE